MISPRVAVIFVFVSAWASPSVAADRASAVAVEDAGLQDLAWLAGHWTQEQNGRTVHELWTVPTSNRMLGLNWTIEREQSIGFEFLRIERGEQGQVAYVAAPGGRSATTSFRLVERGPRRVAFENPDHDFPQRVIYWLEDGQLHARIEGDVGGESRRIDWVYRPES